MSKTAMLPCGTKIKIGDYVGFKSDVEQYAKVISISHDQIELQAPNDGFSGNYIHNQDTHWEDIDRCWKD